jgi:uncharacterized protein YeaO (DUF488 family)
LKAAARAAVFVWKEAISPLMEEMKEHFPGDDEERDEFVARVIADMENESYHLYTRMYLSLLAAN